VVNVHLKRKPDWFVARNPLGKVPTIERDNVVIYDSPITVEWIDAVYDTYAPTIVPKDPTERARQKIVVERLMGVSLAYYELCIVCRRCRVRAHTYAL